MRVQLSLMAGAEPRWPIRLPNFVPLSVALAAMPVPVAAARDVHPKRAAAIREREKVFETLQESGPMTSPTLATVTGLLASKVRHALRSLQLEGRAENVKNVRGHWSWHARGEGLAK